VTKPLDPDVLLQKHALIAAHLEGPVAREEWVQTVEYDAEIPRWYVRFGCDGRDAATIYFDLHQRTLRYEVYFMPDPPANHETLGRFLLQCNHKMYGALLDRAGRRLVPRRAHPARTPRRGRARPHHRGAVRSGGAVVPTRDPDRLRAALTEFGAIPRRGPCVRLRSCENVKKCLEM
jgi:hypothetical protein